MPRLTGFMTALTLALMLPAMGLAQAVSEFEEGVHYVRLTPTQPTSSSAEQVEVTEMFWYGCPHCNAFEPFLEAWEPAEYVNFVRIPVLWQGIHVLHARIYYTAEALGLLEQTHAATFREIHGAGNYLQTPEALEEFFARFGVSPAQFRETFESYPVQERLQHADEMNRRYEINSVPTVVVNGKYKTSASMVGTYDGLLRLVDELAAMEAASE